MAAVIKAKCFQKAQQGLTLVEVIVSMLVSSLFLGTALQAYVAATAMRTQGGSQKEAIAIAQNDMEFIRDEAQNPNLKDPVNPSADCASANGQGYGAKLMNVVQNKIAGNSLPSGVTPSGQGTTQQTVVIDKPNPDGTPGYQLTRTMTVPENSPILSKDVLTLAYVIKDIRLQSNVNSALGGGNPGGNGQGSANGIRDVVVGQFDTAVIPTAALSCP
jgi:prepilin-type N-terminal cleavage/methylation domain-containing protein